jgi:hypothetical protein
MKIPEIFETHQSTQFSVPISDMILVLTETYFSIQNWLNIRQKPAGSYPEIYETSRVPSQS